MTEINDSPFLKDKEYLLTHDLCDIPGFSNFDSVNSEIKIINQMIENKTVEEDDIYYEINNVKNTHPIFGRIKNYIEEAIIIFNVESYLSRSNHELIAKFHGVIGKEISNGLLLLNKMDLSTNPQEDIERFKGAIMKYFPKCKTFNLTLNIFIGLSLEEVQNELLK